MSLYILPAFIFCLPGGRLILSVRVGWCRCVCLNTTHTHTNTKHKTTVRTTNSTQLNANAVCSSCTGSFGSIDSIGSNICAAHVRQSFAPPTRWASSVWRCYCCCFCCLLSAASVQQCWSVCTCLPGAGLPGCRVACCGDLLPTSPPSASSSSSPRNV